MAEKARMQAERAGQTRGRAEPPRAASEQAASGQGSSVDSVERTKVAPKAAHKSAQNVAQNKAPVEDNSTDIRSNDLQMPKESVERVEEEGVEAKEAEEESSGMLRPQTLVRVLEGRGQDTQLEVQIELPQIGGICTEPYPWPYT